MLPSAVTLFNAPRCPARYNRRMPDTIAYTLDSPEVRHVSAADPTLSALIARIGPVEQRLETDRYASLFSAIVGQQLSDAAATAIQGRLIEALGGELTPAGVLATPQPTLRAAGLSERKLSFLRDLAELVVSGVLDLEHLATLPDDEVVKALTSLRGIGRWTAEMFLVFSLGRPDVLAVDDGALRTTVAWLYGLPTPVDRTTVLEIGERWRPYRTCASLYLWRALPIRRAARSRPA